MGETRRRALGEAILRAFEHVERILIVIAAISAVVPVLQWYGERDDRALERRATLVSSFVNCRDIYAEDQEDLDKLIEFLNEAGGIHSQPGGNISGTIDEPMENIARHKEFLDQATMLCDYLTQQIALAAPDFDNLGPLPSIEEILEGTVEPIEEPPARPQPHLRRPSRQE